MSHNPNQVLLGATTSSYREVDSLKGEIDAGKAVRKKSDGTIVSATPGGLLGISLGRDLSRGGYTAICREGLGVPILLTEGFTPTIGDVVNISNTTGLAIASGGGATAVNAVYASGKIQGIPEGYDKTPVDVALIDFVGGL